MDYCSCIDLNINENCFSFYFDQVSQRNHFIPENNVLMEQFVVDSSVNEPFEHETEMVVDPTDNEEIEKELVKIDLNIESGVFECSQVSGEALDLSFISVACKLNDSMNESFERTRTPRNRFEYPLTIELPHDLELVKERFVC